MDVTDGSSRVVQWEEEAQQSPEALGFSTVRLERLREVVRRGVEDGDYPGAVYLVAREGKTVTYEAFGQLDPTSGRLMPRDAVFRIYSMTKPLTSAILLSLFEEGLCLLDDPVSQYLPEFGDTQVLREHAHTTGPKSPMTIEDLLRHTSGLGGGVWGTVELSKRYRDAGIPTFEHLNSIYRMDSSEIVRRLASIPLAHDPGTVWEYGKSGDVLGRVVEEVGQASLDEILSDRLTQPLQMADTAFHLTDSQVDRLARPAFADSALDIPLEPPQFLSGGSGAFSTVPDYANFCQMLLDRGGGGIEGGLAPKTIELMTSDHLGEKMGHGPDYIPGSGYGFGLGVAVRLGKGASSALGSPGDYYWIGRAGTSFIVDPKERIIGILMLQRYWHARKYHLLFRSLLYQAIL